MLNLAKLARNVLFEVTNPPNPIIFLIEDPFSPLSKIFGAI